MRRSYRVAVFLLTGFLGTACGKKSSSAKHDDEAPAANNPATGDAQKDGAGDAAPTNESTPATTPATPAAPADPRAPACLAAWPKHLASHKAGLQTTYEVSIKAKDDPNAKETKRTWTETVTEATDDSVTSERVEKTLLPTETAEKKTTTKVTKDDYIKDCIGLSDNPETNHVETLAQKSESVSVRAGTFDTTYLKTRQSGEDDGDAYTYVSEIWSLASDPGLVVKSVSEWDTQMNGAPYAEVTTIELTGLKQP